MDCGEHRTICSMSHLIIVLLRIIFNRCQSKIISEVAEVQCIFVEDLGTANAIFIFRNIVNRELKCKMTSMHALLITPKRLKK